VWFIVLLRLTDVLVGLLFNPEDKGNNTCLVPTPNKVETYKLQIINDSKCRRECAILGLGYSITYQKILRTCQMMLINSNMH
jgi:hypothetical protein